MIARRAGAVSAAALSGLALTLSLTHAVAPQWAARVGLDVWNLPTAYEQRRVADAETTRTEAQRELLLRQIEAAQHVVARLAEGQLTLVEAVDELEPMLRERTGFDCTSTYHRAPTIRHAAARYAIRHVTMRLADDPTRRAAISAQLETEYAALER